MEADDTVEQCCAVTIFLLELIIGYTYIYTHALEVYEKLVAKIQNIAGSRGGWREEIQKIAAEESNTLRNVSLQRPISFIQKFLTMIVLMF